MCSGLFIINEVSESALEKEEIWPPGRTRKLSFGGKHLWPPASAAAGADGRSLDSASSRAEVINFRLTIPRVPCPSRGPCAPAVGTGPRPCWGTLPPSRRHGGGWGTARGEPAHGEARGARLSLQGPWGAGRATHTCRQEALRPAGPAEPELLSSWPRPRNKWSEARGPAAGRTCRPRPGAGCGPPAKHAWSHSGPQPSVRSVSLPGNVRTVVLRFCRVTVTSYARYRWSQADLNHTPHSGAGGVKDKQGAARGVGGTWVEATLGTLSLRDCP